MIRFLKNTEPASPPANRVTLFVDQIDGNLKLKREDGIVSVFYGTNVFKNVVVEYFTLDQQNIDNSEIVLQSEPTDITKTCLDIIGGSAQMYGSDFEVVNNKLKWLGKDLDGILSAGDRLRVQYFV